MNKTDFLENQIRSLKKRNTILLFLSILLILFCVLFILKGKNTVSDKESGYSLPEESERNPYYEEVHRIIDKLKYSGVEMFLRKDVTLSLDFDKKTWTLHNLHRFDLSGDLILENGSEGTCGELAAYTYKLVKPLFGDKYEIKFAKSAQSGFFLTEKESHITLFIKEKSNDPRNNRVYIIDPGFHKYDHISKFEDYLFSGYMDSLPFMDRKETDADSQIFSAIPLFLGGDYLLGFAVEANNGIFDKRNFVLAIILTKQYRYSGRYLYAIRNNNGFIEKYENKTLAKRVLSEKQYDRILRKIELLFKEVSE